MNNEPEVPALLARLGRCRGMDYPTLVVEDSHLYTGSSLGKNHLSAAATKDNNLILVTSFTHAKFSPPRSPRAEAEKCISGPPSSIQGGKELSQRVPLEEREKGNLRTPNVSHHVCRTLLQIGG